MPFVILSLLVIHVSRHVCYTFWFIKSNNARGNPVPHISQFLQNPSRHGYSHIIILILAKNIWISENVSEFYLNILLEYFGHYPSNSRQYTCEIV